MRPRRLISIGAILAALGIAAGAFGAHALEVALEESGHTETWRTAVRYQVWNALGLILFGLFRERVPGRGPAPWCFLIGTILFSGSLFLLALGAAGKIVGPMTPLGGLLLIIAWIAFAIEAWKSGRSDAPSARA